MESDFLTECFLTECFLMEGDFLIERFLMEGDFDFLTECFLIERFLMEGDFDFLTECFLMEGDFDFLTERVLPLPVCELKEESVKVSGILLFLSDSSDSEKLISTGFSRGVSNGFSIGVSNGFSIGVSNGFSIGVSNGFSMGVSTDVWITGVSMSVLTGDGVSDDISDNCLLILDNISVCISVKFIVLLSGNFKNPKVSRRLGHELFNSSAM
jgi:hypothetical protein